ncbi:MAG: AraC family transcriptional regulator [Ruminococcaceae bacterium]|nr:AraC family transcriptional regulator [Oscillospiraceae bacterium]
MNKTRNFHNITKELSIHSLNSAFRLDCDENFCFEGEIHNFWELVYIADGRACITRDSKTIRLNKGDIIFYKPMDFHCLRADGEPFSVIIISFTSYSNIIEPLCESIFNLKADLREEIEEILFKIKNAFLIDEDGWIYSGGSSLLAENFALTHLEFFLLNILINSPDSQNIDTFSSSDFSKIVTVMQENIDKNLSVSEIASLVGFSPAKLKKIIKKNTGGGVSKYFIMLKITRAITMLQKGMTVCDVSDKLGFSSPSYFSYTFHRETGVSPIYYKG